MSLKKRYCDFYYFALWSVYLCAWCRVFFLFLFRLLINKSIRRLFNFSIYMFCLYAFVSRRSTDCL